MSVPLLKILERLKEENLHGPTLPFVNKVNWANISNEYEDLDSKDPRWFDLFKGFFIDSTHEVNDDIIFFVRQWVDALKSDGSVNEVEPVFVKRRVPNMMPPLADVVDWKLSFFLNLICQLPCTLTVSICGRSHDSSSNLADSNVMDMMKRDEPPKEVKPLMLARQRITKKVFAAPYKSRMDVKDALMNECSFPLVYYTVNDYDSSYLHLSISPHEKMYVELSLTLPMDPSTHSYSAATDLVAGISLEQDSLPFPLPQGYTKVVLFQGAVGFDALNGVYQERGLAAQNQSKGWTRFAGEKPNGVRTEYITICGPKNKGQGQIAISHQDQDESEAVSSSTMTDRLKSFGSLVKNQLVGSVKEYPAVKPKALLASMTYIAIPWQAVASDILDHNHLR